MEFVTLLTLVVFEDFSDTNVRQIHRTDFYNHLTGGLPQLFRDAYATITNRARGQQWSLLETGTRQPDLVHCSHAQACLRGPSICSLKLANPIQLQHSCVLQVRACSLFFSMGFQAKLPKSGLLSS